MSITGLDFILVQETKQIPQGELFMYRSHLSQTKAFYLL
jgi:hypothetical protein